MYFSSYCAAAHVLGCPLDRGPGLRGEIVAVELEQHPPLEVLGVGLDRDRVGAARLAPLPVRDPRGDGVRPLLGVVRGRPGHRRARAAHRPARGGPVEAERVAVRIRGLSGERRAVRLRAVGRIHLARAGGHRAGRGVVQRRRRRRRRRPRGRHGGSRGRGAAREPRQLQLHRHRPAGGRRVAGTGGHGREGRQRDAGDGDRPGRAGSAAAPRSRSSPPLGLVPARPDPESDLNLCLAEGRKAAPRHGPLARAASASAPRP